MVIFQILLLNDKRVISKERNTVRASNPRASLTWTDNTSKVGYVFQITDYFHYFEKDGSQSKIFSGKKLFKNVTLQI